MDSRLSLVSGKRVSRLRRQDLPDLAYALTMLSRQPQDVSFGYLKVQGAGVITFRAKFFAVVVLLEDWLKIEPYVRDGSFAPNTFPVQVMSPLPPRPPQTSGDPLYNRILSVLTSLFPDSYPTSSI